jgi:hypothetical protein
LNGENIASSPVDGKHSAGVCAAGMGLYPMAPMGGFYIGPMGTCAGASNGACSAGGGGGVGGACGGGVSTYRLVTQDILKQEHGRLGRLWGRKLKNGGNNISGRGTWGLRG